MSVDYTVYVGPFLKCINGKVKKTETYLGCEKNDAHTAKSPSIQTPFCPWCGWKIIEKTREVEDAKIIPWELSEEIDSNLRSFEEESADLRGFDLWTPNQHFIDRKTDFDRGDLFELCIPVSACLIETETNLFLEVFGKEIETIKEAYGEENVSVEWGVLGEIN